MALTITELNTKNVFTSNTTSASVTSDPDVLLLALCSCGAPRTFAPTSDHGTWFEIDDQSGRFAVWACRPTGVISDGVTVAVGGGGVTLRLTVFEISGVDIDMTSDASVVLQRAAKSHYGAADRTHTYSAFGSSDNYAMIFSNRGAASSYEAGFNEALLTGVGSAYREGDADLAVTYSHTSGTGRYIFWELGISAGGGGLSLDLAAGTISLTGGDLDVLVSRNLALAGGVFSSTGGDVTFQRGRVLELAGGAYSLTGGDLGLLASRTIAMNAGGFSLTGGALDIAAGLQMALESGNFSLTGGDVDLLTARQLGLASGTYTVNGGDLGLVYTPSLGEYSLSLESGSFSLTGEALSLLNSRLLELGAGTVGVTGGDLDIVNGYILDIESGTFLLTGQTLDLDRTRAITLEQGDIIVTGGALQLQSSGDISSTIVMRHQNTEESFRLVDVESGELAINLTTGKMWTVDHLLNITTVGGLYDGKDLPKSDPQTSGAWWNDDGTLKVSNG